MKLQCILIFLIFLGLGNVSIAQSLESGVLSYQDFMERVQKEHPLSKQAQLQESLGEAEVKSSRGLFDPKVYSEISQKYYEGNQYYSLAESGLKVPTWFGIELQAAYENNDGRFLNPENRVPSTGLYFAGISVPVGRGLFIDERRAALRKALIYNKSTAAIRQSMLNELYLNAANTYWSWFKAYHQKEVYKSALLLAEERMKATKRSADLGDRPYIDTLEAGIQLQNRKLNWQEASLNYKNSTAKLNVFLWDEGLVPLEVDSAITPSSIDSISLNNLTPSLQLMKDSLITNHPEIRMIDFKIEQLDIDRKLRLEMIKPQLDLKYQPLVEGVGNEVVNNYSLNNYQWGLTFSFPILTRNERGRLNQTKVEMHQSELDKKAKQQEIKFKVDAALNRLKTSKSQAELYRQTSEDYFKLLQGERVMFNNGESSVFMINSRELGYINAQLTLIELITQNKNTLSEVKYHLGVLAN